MVLSGIAIATVSKTTRLATCRDVLGVRRIVADQSNATKTGRTPGPWARCTRGMGVTGPRTAHNKQRQVVKERSVRSRACVPSRSPSGCRTCHTCTRSATLASRHADGNAGLRSSMGIQESLASSRMKALRRSAQASHVSRMEKAMVPNSGRASSRRTQTKLYTKTGHLSIPICPNF